MRIPVYQQSVGYQKAYAQNVALAQPTRQSMGKNKWSDWATAGDVMQSLYQLPFAAKRTAQTYKNASQAFEEVLATQPAAPADAAAHAAAPAQAETATPFSSAKRQEQLSFARGQAWQPAAAEKNAQTKEKSAVEKLDENFAGLISADFNTANEDLLAQDYVILRREMQNLQNKETRRQQQENWRQGAGAFVQTAALIRTPKALEEYINNNISAAQKEAAQNGLEGAQKEQLNTLYTQAVRHNVQAALQSGETEQAQAVYSHFAKRLSPQESDLLVRKITAREADQKAQALWPAARQSCVEKDGSINQDKLAAFAAQNSAQKSEDSRQDLQQALRAQLQAQQHKDWRRRAQGYRRLISGLSAGEDLAALMEEDGFDRQEFEQNQQALRLYQAQPEKTSSAPVFNRLQRLIWQGKNPQKELSQALQKGELSAPDYWRLKARNASAQADGTDVREVFLSAALDKFFKEEQLDTQTAQQISHFVFSSAGDWQQQLAAARTVRQIFQLQESKQ